MLTKAIGNGLEVFWVMGKLRQPLLPFTSKPPLDKLPKAPDPSNHRSSILSTPQPGLLPTRLWDRILDLLGTFAQKKFRLVCLQWSVLGAKHLYSTVYLNRYESSLSGLISISSSRHASFVKKIVWNLLELPEECLDGETWSSRYQNLLRGLKHRQMLLFHQSYAAVYRDRKRFWRSSDIKAISGAVNSLPHCHEIVLSDDYDVETSCQDHYFRGGIRSDSNLPNNATTWALRPQMWEWTEDHRESLLAAEDMFQALRDCRYITCLRIHIWAQHWNTMNDVIRHEYTGYRYSPRSIRTLLTYPHISELEFKLRFCELRWLWIEEHSIQRALESAIECTNSFPELKELSFITLPSEPGPGFVKQYPLEPESSDDDDASNDASLTSFWQPRTTASELLTKHAKAEGLTDTILNCMYAEMLPSASPLPNLSVLRFANVTLDMRLLLYWLASHKQLPNSTISVHLLGTTVLYGLDPVLFLEALSQLNVRISYNSKNAFYHPLDSRFGRYINTPCLDCYLTNGRQVASVRRWSKDVLYSPDTKHMLEPFPQFHGKPTPQCATFTHRPDELERLIIDYAKNEFLNAQTIFYSYCISLDERKNGSSESGRLKPYLYGPIDPEEPKQKVALVTLNLIPGPPDEDALLYVETESEEIDSGISALEEILQDTRVQQEIEEQELLRQYEVKFLGLDLIDV